MLDASTEVDYAQMDSQAVVDDELLSVGNPATVFPPRTRNSRLSCICTLRDASRIIVTLFHTQLLFVQLSGQSLC